MKKALEAGIEFCNKNINYKTNSNDYLNYVCENYVRSYKAIRHVLKAMLAALDEEPEKPQPQGSLVDWVELRKLIYNSATKYYAGRVVKYLEDHQSKWLHPKPAIDPEIKRVWEKFKQKDTLLNTYPSGGYIIEDNEEMWEAIKAHCERG